MLGRVNHFMDQVLIVMTAAHERDRAPEQPGTDERTATR